MVRADAAPSAGSDGPGRGTNIADAASSKHVVMSGARIADFFIIGASKCGTTALSEYLRTHPRICFARTKEPHFFSEDFPLQRLDHSFEEYWRRNFSYFDPSQHSVIGEGSGTYYLSDVAIPNILKLNPRAKFLYMVRNPVDMCQSWYYDLRFSNAEDVSFEKGWELQALRRQGLHLPRQLREARFVQYRMMASLGSRLEQFRKIIPDGQLLVIVFDDFMCNPKAIYESVLAFLGVPSDGREVFQQVNPAKVQRNRLLGYLASSMPRWLSNPARLVKRVVGLDHARFNLFAVLNARAVERAPLAPEFRRYLIAEFEPELCLLERHLDRDLSAWRA